MAFSYLLAETISCSAELSMKKVYNLGARKKKEKEKKKKTKKKTKKKKTKTNKKTKQQQQKKKNRTQSDIDCQVPTIWNRLRRDPSVFGEE